MFHDRSLLGRCFRGFVLLVLEYCSAVWFSAADTHHKLLDRAVSDGVFEYDIAHRRSVAILCMVHKIRCNSVHPLNGALKGPYVPVRVTRGALVPHRCTHPIVRRTLFSIFSVPLERSLWSEPRIRSCGTIFPFLFLFIGWYCGADRMNITLSQPCTADVF